MLIVIRNHLGVTANEKIFLDFNATKFKNLSKVPSNFPQKGSIYRGINKNNQNIKSDSQRSY